MLKVFRWCPKLDQKIDHAVGRLATSSLGGQLSRITVPQCDACRLAVQALRQRIERKPMIHGHPSELGRLWVGPDLLVGLVLILPLFGAKGSAAQRYLSS